MGQFSEFYNLDLLDANLPPDDGHLRLIRNKNATRNPFDPTVPFYAKHSDGYLEPIGGIPASTPFSFQRFVINYTDFQPNATGTGNILLGQVPAGSLIISAKLKPTIQWASSSDTSAGLIISANDPASGTNPVNFIQLSDIGGVLFSPVTAFTGTNSFSLSPTKVVDQNALSNIYANLDVQNGGGVIDNLTQGQVILWILTIQGI